MPVCSQVSLGHCIMCTFCVVFNVVHLRPNISQRENKIHPFSKTPVAKTEKKDNETAPFSCILLLATSRDYQQKFFGKQVG